MPDRTPAPPAPRGTCLTCRRSITLTKAGKVRHHGDKNRHVWPPRRCEGAGADPLEDPNA
jgi:hypothetical protein